MKCNVLSLEAKQAKNENWYVCVIAQPADDVWAEEWSYKMWVSESLAKKLSANKPEFIELRKAVVKVTPFQRVDDEGTINPHIFDSLTIVVRQFRGEDADDAEKMANKLRASLLKDGKIVDLTNDDFAGAMGDLPD